MSVIPGISTDNPITTDTDTTLSGVLVGDSGKVRAATNSEIVTEAELNAGLATKANLSHTHGNISNAGAIGTTANLPVITGADGVLQASSFGTAANTFCQGNDPRLSDARTPVAHTHPISEVVGLATLLDNFRPVVLTQPLAASGNVGDSLSISCLGGILPNTHLNLTYQWQLSTDAGVSYTNVSGATSATLPFNPALVGNNGLYRCRLTNAFGSQDTNAVSLTVDGAIQHLYRVNDRGIAWDLDRMDHLFQLSTGGTPVTAYGDPVGLAVGRERGGLDNLGPELVADPTTVRTVFRDAVTSTQASSGVNAVAGTSYVIELIVSSNTSTVSSEVRIGGNLLVWNSSQQMSIPAGFVGTVRFCAVASFNGLIAVIGSANLSSLTITNFSIKTISSNRLIQSNSLRRPTYARRPKRGVVNILQRTTEIENGFWTKTNLTWTANDPTETSPLGLLADKLTESTDTVSTNHQVSLSLTQTFTSGLTYTFSIYAKSNGRNIRLGFPSAAFTGGPTVFFNLSAGTIISGTGGAITSLGNGWFRCSVTATATATASSNFLTFGPASGGNRDYIGNGTSGIWVDHVQLEIGTLTAPQRVGNQFDVTETGQPSINYLWFDGIDDCMQSATAINFSNSDEMTVSVGQRKLRTMGTASAVIGITDDPLNTNGSFEIQSPGALHEYLYSSRGSVRRIATTVSFPQPDLGLLTGQANISDDVLTLRRNGTQIASSTDDQGSGNYANAVLHLGARAGSSLFFSGHINSGFIINRILNPLVLADYEKYWVAAKSGIDLP